jgi:hypothetical protein
LSQILALAILAVFAVGYLKLLWTNRLVKRQELVDEEKRMRIQELRSSGQIVESRKSHDIPFGVRAIQSGITVDGIWISQSTTPIPSELKLGHIHNGSSDMVGTVDSSKSAGVTVDTTPQAVRPSSRQGRQPFRDSETGELVTDQVTGTRETTGPERPGSSGTRLSYKPRRSSHLRFGSYGEYDEATLDQLEGKLSPQKKIYTHRPRGSQNELEVDSASAADNERSSGTSDDSDATLSYDTKSHSRQLLLPQNTPSEASSTRVSLVPSNKPVRASPPLQSSRTEYFTIPIDSPGNEASDPFATPLESPLGTPAVYKSQTSPTAPDPSWLDESQSQVSHQIRSPSPFVPGELHVNKTVRKVNSGFEILPAGTFGTPSEFKGKGVDTSQDEDSGERRQSKLQKKPRTSLTGRRPSSTFDRP